MKRKFKSVKSVGLGLLLVTVSVLIIAVSFGLPVITKKTTGSAELIIKSLVSVLIIGFFTWCWTRTYYEISKTRITQLPGYDEESIPHITLQQYLHVGAE